MSFNSIVYALIVVLTLSACGGSDQPASTAPAAPDVEDDIPTREVEAPIEAATYEAFQLSAGDLDTYAKGLAFENGRLAEATQKTGEERMAAFVAALPEQTEPAAAASLGVSVDHYRNVKQAVNDVLGNFEAQAMLQRAQDAAASDATAPPIDENIAAMQAEIDDPYSGLDSAVADALRSRKAALEKLRAENIALLFQAGG